MRLDLIGPEPSSAQANERLPLQPSRWYLTGFLVPYEGGKEQRSDFAVQDEIDLAGADDAAGVDAAPPEQASRRKAFLPSSLGVSVLVPAGATSLTIDVDWGDCVREMDDDEGEADSAQSSRVWQRKPRHESVAVFLVNNREPAPDGVRDHAFAFQAALTLKLPDRFVPRPDPRG